MKMKLPLLACLLGLSVSAFASPLVYECVPEYSDSLNVQKVTLAEKTKTVQSDHSVQKTYIEMKIEQKNNSKKLTFQNETLLEQELSDLRSQFDGAAPVKGMIFRSSNGKKAVMANMQFVVFGGSQRHRLYLTLAIDGQVVENLSCN